MDPVKNFAKVNVSGYYDGSATEITLVAGEGLKLPDPSTEGAYNLVWWNATDYNDTSDDPNVEIVRVTAKVDDVITVTRAQEDTGASTKNISGRTYIMILAMTKKTIDDLEDAMLIEDTAGVVTFKTDKTTFNLGTAELIATMATFTAMTAMTMTYINNDYELTSLASGTANQVLGVNSTTNGYEYKSILGTSNQVSVTHAANSITFSTPQDIATTSSPTFNTLTVTTGLIPEANDGAYLGTSSLGFSDLFLADGGVINWNAGNATLTHSTGLLTSNVQITATNFKIPDQSLGNPTYSTLNDNFNSFSSCGRKTGGAISDAGSSYIAVAAGTGYIKATDDDNAQLMNFNWDAPSNILIPADTVRYIGVEYNAGSPRVVARTVWNWNKDSEFSLGRVINETINGVETLHIISNPWWVTDGITNVIERIRGFGRIMKDETVGGGVLSVSGTRNIAVTAMTLWSNLNEFTCDGIDTSGADTIELYWYKAGEGWQDGDVTQYSVLLYNDVTQTTLQNLGNNKYANIWVYAEADDCTFALIYPQRQYNTAAEAEAATTLPILPTHIQNNGYLIGRIIIKQNVDAPVKILQASTSSYTSSTATNHNDLAGLQLAASAITYGHIDDQAQTIAGAKTFSSAPTLSTMTAGSILFAGTAGAISQDNSNLFWDNTNKRLGLGIITPADAIHIVNTLGSNIILNTNTGTVSTGIYMTEGSSGTSKNNGAYVYYNGSTNTFNIATGSGIPTDKLTIARDTGNVGIGTTSPAHKLEVNGTDDIYAQVRSIGADSTAGIVLFNDVRSWVLKNEGGDSDKFQIRDATANAQRLTIDNSGRLGLGTTNPTALLSVLDEDAGIDFGRESSAVSKIIGRNGSGYNDLDIRSGAIGTGIYLKTSGNIGIGTTSPAQKLYLLNGAFAFQNGLSAYLTTGTYSTIYGTNNGGAYPFNNYNNLIIQSSPSNDRDILFITGTTPTPKLAILGATGNVGIGTTSPISELDVVGNIIATSSHSTSTEKAGRFGTNHYNTSEKPFYGVYTYSASTNNILLLGGGTSAGNAATIISFYTAANTTTLTGTERMRVDSAGNVGIGTTSPVGKLEINASSIYHLTLNNTLGTENKRIFGFAVGDSSQNLNINALNDSHSWVRGLMTIQHDGNVGVGTTNPTQKFEINGGATHGFPLTSETTQTYGRFRLENNEASNAVLDIGIYGTNGAWIQATLKTDLSTNYPLLLNPNGGNVGIGTTSPSFKLQIQDTTAQTTGMYLLKTQATTDNIVNFNSTIQINHTSGTRASAIGIYSSTSATGSGGTTTSVYTFHSAATINAGATVTNLYGLYIGAPTNNGTLTSHYGLFVASQTSANNNYGLYLQNSQYNTMTCLARDGVLYLNEGSATASQYYSISFLRTHSDTGANVATIDAEMLGAIHWRGNSGTGVTYGAGIYAKQIGSAGTTTPTALYFQTADGTHAMTTRLYILPTGESLFGAGATSIAVGGIAGKIQVQGTDAGKSSITTTRYSNDANPAYIAFGKSRGETVGTYTIVQDNDILGRIDFNASDGTDINSRGASIFARINGTPGSNDVPTELVFCTTADGASDVTEHMAIDSTGAVTIYGATPSLTFTDINTSADSVIDCSSNAGSMFISADQNNESANTVMAFKVDGTERGRFTSNGNFLVGSTDDDGTPTTGRLVAQGSTNDGSTNIFVGRDSDGSNVFTVDTNGVILPSGGYKSSDGTAGWTGTFTEHTGKTVTVKNGLITNVA